ncbi:MAG: chromosome segregation protein SMC [Bacteroidetes bacterium CG_4_9_14_3_um_filter_41_19]|nr:MAG: chromosome segregation protein SMC [Bacteroidetes bacterium CG_4_9_14_3_um_filter_41_19]
MRIESIKLKNYKAFQNLELNNLPELAIFVGANGAGKTTLFDTFGFLSDSLKNNIRQALAKRGGFKEVISRGQSGLIEIELQFRLVIAGKNRLVTYRLEIGEQSGKPIIEREILRYKRGAYGSPYHFLDFSKGSGYAITNEEDFDKPDEELDREEQKLGSPDILAIKGLGQFDRFKAASAFRSFIENWHVSDFHIAEAKPSREAGYAEHLSPTGENLPLVAQYMFENHKELFNQVLEKMKRRVPGVSDVTAEATVDGRIVLRFQDGSFKDPFIANYVSDGTIKMFAYLLVLHDPNPHPLLCVEEPENQLYPNLLIELLDEFRLYAKRGGQVFVSSHSPDLLNGAKPEEAYWLVKRKGYSKIERASDHNEILSLYEEGDKLGYLWKENYFKGSNPI